MTIFNWNPIRRRINEVTNIAEYSTVPITFVPKHYVRQCKHRLYNNLMILLGGLWALTISHDMDISDIKTRIKLKNIVTTSGLFVSHFVAVPLIIGKLHLHYSIVLGAIGMGVTPFFYYINDTTVLTIVICIRFIFVALFDISAMIYIVKLARICAKIQGNAVFDELLTMRSFIMIFSCTASFVSSAWRKYTEEPDSMEYEKSCGSNYCPRKLLKKPRLTTTLSTGQNILFIAVAIVGTLSGLILIAMYLEPVKNLGDRQLSGKPRVTSPFRMLRQFKKSKVIHLAMLITSCAIMYGMIDEFFHAYVICSLPIEYRLFLDGMKQFSLIFGVMTCVTLVDFTGFRWLYMIALFGQLSSYVCLVFWDHFAQSELSYFIVYHVLCTSISIEMSILQLFVVQALGDEEVSAWCLYYVIGDVVYLFRTIADIYLCTSVKLWILIGISPFTLFALIMYSCEFDDNSTSVSLFEFCSLLIKTPKKRLEKSASFDLNIVVENFENIRKVETFLERKYTLQSLSLVPSSDAVFSETA